MAVIGKLRGMIWLLVPVIIIAILSFLLMDIFGSGNFSSSNKQPTSGMVNGQEVNYREYTERINNAVNQQRQANPSMSDAQRMQVEESAWQQYLTELVTKAEFDKLGLGVNKDEMRDLLVGTNPHRYVSSSAQFKDEAGNFDPSKVQAFNDQVLEADEETNPQFAAYKESWANFQKSVREDQHFVKYGNLVKKSVYMPSWQAEMSSQEDGKAVNFNYVKIPYTAIEYDAANITDADLNAYINNNAATYKKKANVSMDYIVIDVKPSAADIEATRQALDDERSLLQTTTNDSIYIVNNSESTYSGAYQTATELSSIIQGQVSNLGKGQISSVFQDGQTFKMIKVTDVASVPDSVKCSHILVAEDPADPSAAKTKIDSILTAIRGGADWDSMAALFSTDKSNSENGGDLKWAKKNAMVPPFNAKLFYDGSVPGQLKTVKTRFGWHIIRIDDIATTSQGRKLAILSKTIEPSQETSRLAYQQASDFSSSVNASNFTSEAEAAGHTVQQVFTKTLSDNTLPGIGSNNQALTWAFQNTVGNVSPVIDTGEKFVVAHLTEKNAAGVPPLNSIRALVTSAVTNMKKAEMVKGENFASLQDAASKYNVTSKTASNVKFASTAGLPSDLSGEGNVQAAAYALGANQMSNAIEGRSGVYFVEVTSVVDAPASADYSSIAKTKITTLRSNADGRAVSALKNAANIEDTRHTIRSY